MQRLIYSITDSKQKGCPVATVGINNSINAAQLAARFLAVSDVNLRLRLIKHLADQSNAVVEKAEKMDHIGFEEYFSPTTK